MATVTDPSSIELYAIIGAPLLAIVQAESQASQATANFIEQVGFEPLHTDTSGKIEYGKLKVITFRYSKADISGEPSDFIVEIPVLSIVPIPSIIVRNATIDFSVEVNDVVQIEQKTAINPVRKIEETGGDNATPAVNLDSTLDPQLVAFKGALGKHDSKTAMKVHVNIEQSDTPAGMLALYRLLDQGISIRSTSDSEKHDPTLISWEKIFGSVVIRYKGNESIPPTVKITAGVQTSPVEFTVDKTEGPKLVIKNSKGIDGNAVVAAWNDADIEKDGFEIIQHGDSSLEVRTTGAAVETLNLDREGII